MLPKQNGSDREAAPQTELASSILNRADFKLSADVVSQQSASVLAALQKGPKTTTELRQLCGALSPAARVLDLRNAGHRIATCRAGRQARYVLESAQ